MSTTAEPPVTAAWEFVKRPGGHGLLVDGESSAAAAGRTFATIDPASEQELCQIALADAADVERAALAAQAAFDHGWSTMAPARRGALIERLAGLVEDHADELAAIETLDNGKPLRISRAVDLPTVIQYLRYYAGWPTKIEGSTLPVSVPETFAYTRREPIGVVGLIIPWNYPLLSTVHKVGPALAAGCTILLKPAEQTPLSALRLGELALEAGIPAGVLNVLTGDGTTGAAIVDSPHVAKISFTGSTAVGREIGAKASAMLKRVTLELGGKAPNVVLPDADVEAAARGAFLAGYFNSGQVCQAGTRIYAPRPSFDDFVAALSARSASARLGPGLDPDTQFGPLISDEQRQRVTGYVEAGLDAGATLVAGGPQASVPEQGWFVAPTLFVDVEDSMSIAREEIFGPVLVAQPYDDLEEVVRRANSTEYGLSAYLWTKELGSAHKIAARLRAGSVFVNMPTAGDPAAPFGGLKSSGFGRESGRESLDAYLETKTVWTSIA